jgi:cytochrome c biogenesis protein CcmG/thiol:disulfide interchange protein DsbE
MDDKLSAAGADHSERRKPGALLILLAIGMASGVVMALLTIIGPTVVDPTIVGPQRQAGPTPVPDYVAVGKPAPDFTGETVDGATLTLSDLQGSPVALNFWATWCVPCTVEMPALESAAARYADQHLIVLAVNAGESPAAVEAFMDEYDLTFPALLDRDGDILDLYGVRYFPTTIWVDADGVVQAEHLGPLTDDLIDRYVADLTGG